MSGVEVIDEADVIGHAEAFHPVRKPGVPPQPARPETRGLPLAIRDIRKSFGDNEVLRRSKRLRQEHAAAPHCRAGQADLWHHQLR
jgi:hypothetical protein